MFQLLYNFYHYCRKRSERTMTLAVLGIDNAGKTTLVNTVKGELDAEVSPTFGFNSHTLTEGGCQRGARVLGAAAVGPG